jgi:hypothetical protein
MVTPIEAASPTASANRASAARTAPGGENSNTPER